ncbi:MAG: uracil-DNA glycosylase [Candidatus Kariarchaeaceae archaeon]
MSGEEGHDQIIESMKTCTKCELHEGRTQVVIGDYASSKGKICFIGEAPGFNEDQQGRPFVGRSGKLLDRMLNEIGMSRDQVSVLNINKCRPPNNRTPTNMEMKLCGNLWLTYQLEYLQPYLLVTLGSVALRYFFPKAKMTASKGNVMTTASGLPIFPMFHPSYILRQGNTMDDDYLADFKAMKKQFLRQKTVELTDSVENIDQQNLEDFF